jgi:XRE family transcriptional regulator, regulator of sulfur utilization
MDDLASRLAKNIKQLREARGFTQQQMAKLSSIPRATWANLESGVGNPTLAVLHRAAQALHVTIEELISTPRATTQFYECAKLPVRVQGAAQVRKLLPDSIPGMEIDRLELAPQGRMTGVPHTPGTREYLTCESGSITLVAAGQRWVLNPGDVVVFQGDQRHSYLNPGAVPAVGYSVVVLVAGVPERREVG